MQFDDAPAAELVPRLVAVTAEIVLEKPGLVAYVAWLFWSVRMGSLACWHPDEECEQWTGTSEPWGAGAVGPCTVACGVVLYVKLLQALRGSRAVRMASLSA